SRRASTPPRRRGSTPKRCSQSCARANELARDAPALYKRREEIAEGAMTSSAATQPVRPRVGPFAGVLIADLTHALSGPFVPMLLAGLGARVGKVERPPAGDMARAFGPFIDGHGMMFTFANRGKESVALDVEVHPDRELFLALARRADVVVENFRPG